jgi:peptide/nickel transport system substrate-binding protein
MKRLLRIGAALAFALAALPFGHTLAAENKPLVVARDMDLNSLDPGRALCDTCQIYLAATYETLVTLDANNQIVPLLAKSWDVDNQQMHYVFHLADQAVFSDGTPVTAKDVKFSFQRLINLKAGPSFYVDDVKAVNVVDDHTVAIDLKAPNSSFLGILAATFIGITNSAEAMAHGASDADDAATKDTAEPWFLTHSAGSGPYVLSSYKPNDELRLTRNPKYWRNPAPINDVVLRQVKDSVTQSQMLENGGADIAMQVDPDTAKSVHSPDVVIRSAPSFNFIYLALSPGAKGTKGQLSPDVRQAVAAALDYKGIIDVTLGGEGRPIATPIPLGFPGGDGHKVPVQDLPRAKQLMAKVGLSSGLDITAMFAAVNSYGVDFSLLMQKIQQDLAQINIRLHLQPMPFPVWQQNVNGDGIPITIGFFAPDCFCTTEYVKFFAMMPDTVWARRSGAKNDPSIFNQREVDLYAKALASSGEAMQKFYFDVGEEMIKDRIIIPLLSPNQILAYRKDIEGVRASTCCILEVVHISRK